MSAIKPFSSFNAAQNANDFPALLLYWHQDDVREGDLTWVDRVSGVVLTSSVALSKDSEGVYSATASHTLSGTMPIPGINCCLLTIFHSGDNSSTVGGLITIGDTAAATTAPGISTNGAISDGMTTGFTGPAATLANTPTAVATGSNSCRATALLAGATRINVLANSEGGAATIGTDSDATTGTFTNIANTTLGASNADFRSIDQGSGARAKVIALLGFSSALTLNELQIACAEMARTGNLFAGWRNRA